jgi:hypothetical protein
MTVPVHQLRFGKTVSVDLGRIGREKGSLRPLPPACWWCRAAARMDRW